MEDAKTIELLKPVKLGNITYSKLELREPTAGEMAKAERDSASSLDSVITLISLVAGIPRKAVEGLCQRDFSAADLYLAGFSAPGRPAGETPSQS